MKPTAAQSFSIGGRKLTREEQPRCPESWWTRCTTREEFAAKLEARKLAMNARGLGLLPDRERDWP